MLLSIISQFLKKELSETIYIIPKSSKHRVSFPFSRLSLLSLSSSVPLWPLVLVILLPFCSLLFWGNDLIKAIHPRLGPCLLFMCTPRSTITASIMPYAQWIWFDLSVIHSFMCYSSQGHLDNKQRTTPTVPNFLTQRSPLFYFIFSYGPRVL